MGETESGPLDGRKMALSAAGLLLKGLSLSRSWPSRSVLKELQCCHRQVRDGYEAVLQERRALDKARFTSQPLSSLFWHPVPAPKPPQRQAQPSFPAACSLPHLAQAWPSLST